VVVVAVVDSAWPRSRHGKQSRRAQRTQGARCLNGPVQCFNYRRRGRRGRRGRCGRRGFCV